ncbi:MAG: FtsQ-type POTRA domain-containing protein [Deltaproteobacteria bacterium]|nr:FtsQ-type POTRA domain-containing protein [Deltaproteobacteria bacterium]
MKNKNKKNNNKIKTIKKGYGKHFLNYIYLTMAMVFILITGFFGYKAYNYFIYKKKIFILKKISIAGKGISYKEKINILRLAGLYEGENLFNIDLKRVSRLIASDRWINNVTVYKKYPDEVVIVLKKRHIFAMVNKKNLYYISKSGYIIGRANGATGYNYSVVTGLNNKDSMGNYFDKIKRAIYFLNISRFSVIANHISEIHIERDNGIVVYTNNAILIKFGIGRYKEKLKTLKRLLYEIDKVHLKYKRYINLEYKDEAVIAVNPGSRVLPAGYKKNVVPADIFK